MKEKERERERLYIDVTIIKRTKWRDLRRRRASAILFRDKVEHFLSLDARVHCIFVYHPWVKGGEGGKLLFYF